MSRSLGDGPIVAATLHELGGVLLAQGELGEARARLEASLEMRYALHGPQREGRAHPGIATTLVTLGKCVARQGQLLSGLDRCRQGLSMLRTIHAAKPNHADIITTQRVVHRLTEATDFQILALAEPAIGRRVVLSGPPLAPRLQGQVAVYAARDPRNGGHVVALLDANGRESAITEHVWVSGVHMFVALTIAL